MGIFRKGRLLFFLLFGYFLSRVDSENGKIICVKNNNFTEKNVFEGNYVSFSSTNFVAFAIILPANGEDINLSVHVATKPVPLLHEVTFTSTAKLYNYEIISTNSEILLIEDDSIIKRYNANSSLHEVVAKTSKVVNWYIQYYECKGGHRSNKHISVMQKQNSADSKANKVSTPFILTVTVTMIYCITIMF
ncbi:unnamed protein product [Tenebrio molitor]|nr:unnamed protein product [Tenebrio molitor]